MMKIILYILLSFPLLVLAGGESKDGRLGTDCSSPLSRVGGSADQCEVRIVQLVVTPERYHQKKVTTKGTISVQFEGAAIADFNGLIWLSLSKEQLHKYKELDGKVVRVFGTYSAMSFGHLGQYDGTINNVTHIQEM